MSQQNTNLEQTLLLIDGHAMFHRAYHALTEEMSTRSGEPTNATYGFTRMLLDVLRTTQPDYVAVAFDRPAPTFRHREFHAYKAQRPPLPDSMRPQFTRVRQIIAAFNIPIYEVDGYEGDDILGTLAAQATRRSLQTTIATGDLDTLQLVGPQVRVTFARQPRRGEMEVYDEWAVQARYGFSANKLPDYKALVGDTSDNIPGVPGIGAKTASKLIAEYGSLEAILAHANEQSPKVRAALDEYAEQARKSKWLATIVCDAPITLNLDACRANRFNRERVLALFRDLEFYSLVDRVPYPTGPAVAGMEPQSEGESPDVSAEPGAGGADSRSPAELASDGIAQLSLFGSAAPAEPGAREHSAPASAGLSQAITDAPGPKPALAPTGTDRLEASAMGEAASPADYGRAARGLTIVASEQKIVDTLTVTTEAALAVLARSLASAGAFALDLETTATNPLQAELVGLALSMGAGEAYYIPVGHTSTPQDEEPGPQLPLALILERLRPIMANAGIAKYAHNAKYDLTVLERYGVPVQGLACDTMVGAYLLNPGRRGLGLKDQVFEHLNIVMTPITDLIGKGAKQISFAQVPVRAAADYAGADALMTYRLVAIIERHLRERGLYDLFTTIEMPLIPVLVAMELAGIRVDPDLLQRMADDLTRQLQGLEREVYAAVGHEFNINSTRQLADVLFKDLRLPPARKTRTGYSVDAEVLESLRGKHEVIDSLLEYRQLLKLKSTYVDGLLPLIDPRDGRVHTSFNQTIASTGRLSSSEPNLQNIPIRTEVGRQIRRAFVAADGCLLLAADYSQVELRILAHITREPRLVQAFVQGEDIHAATAATLYGIPITAVTPAQRRLGKTLNFAIIYGQSPYGLSRVADIPVDEAAQFIRNYEATFPGVKRYVEETLTKARTKGYVETLLGRRRYLPDMATLPAVQRQAAEREAMNMPIQGTNADIIKIAMIRLHRSFTELEMKTRMILQVHDELLFEVPESELELAKGIVRATMEGAMELIPPLRVEIKVGKNWYEVE
jgi:DNA polymerase-1